MTKLIRSCCLPWLPAWPWRSALASARPGPAPSARPWCPGSLQNRKRRSNPRDCRLGHPDMRTEREQYKPQCLVKLRLHQQTLVVSVSKDLHQCTSYIFEDRRATHQGQLTNLRNNFLLKAQSESSIYFRIFSKLNNWFVQKFVLQCTAHAQTFSTPRMRKHILIWAWAIIFYSAHVP